MVNVVSMFRGLLPSASIDSPYCRLHYQFTVIILMLGVLQFTLIEYFGNPVHCHFLDDPQISPSFLNKYCSMAGTFIIKRSITVNEQSVVEKNISNPEAPESTKEFVWYQWVPIALFIQTICFYIPRYLWKIGEGGRIKMLTIHLNHPAQAKNRTDEKTEPLLDYFSTHLHEHDWYAYKYVFVELLNFVNVVGQILLMNYFLGEGFKLTGIYKMFYKKRSLEEGRNLMETVFPTITKCTYTYNNILGSIHNANGFCVLTQNSSNEKMYTFLYIWFHVLAIITLFAVIYRISVMCLPRFRVGLLRLWSNDKSDRDVEVVHNQLWYGDWFMMEMLHRNMDALTYKEFISRLARSYDTAVLSNKFP